MSHWLALLPAADAGCIRSLETFEQQALAWWALQFTPRVAVLDEAVVLEVASSLRLFGGAAALHARVAAGPQRAAAAAPTALAALALLRVGRPGAFDSEAAGGADGPGEPSRTGVARWLDPLPLSTLSAAAPHEPTLARLGCRTLGQLQALPRGGLSRRFGAGLLRALDQAYGRVPPSLDWIRLPEVFDAALDLPGRIDAAPALMHGARRLLQALGAWLAARQAGVRSIVLGWRHDFGPRDAGAGGELCIRTAVCTRQVGHLERLLSERLARTTLLAPVGVLRLRADEIEPLAQASAALWPGFGTAAAQVEQVQWTELVERLSARLGADRVLRPHLQADHRLSQQVAWVPATREPVPQAPAPAVPGAVLGGRHPHPHPNPPGGMDRVHPAGWPQPAWLLREPLALATRDGQPLYQGAVRLLLGPQRIEAGWWDGRAAVARDYYVGHSARAGLLCLYRLRLPGRGSASEPVCDPAPRLASHPASGGREATWYLEGLYG